MGLAGRNPPPPFCRQRNTGGRRPEISQSSIPTGAATGSAASLEYVECRRVSVTREPSPANRRPEARSLRRSMPLSDFDLSCVEPDTGPVAFERAGEEGFDPLVDLLAQARNLALRDAGAAHGFHKIVDRAGRYVLDIFLGGGGREGGGRQSGGKIAFEAGGVAELQVNCQRARRRRLPLFLGSRRRKGDLSLVKSWLSIFLASLVNEITL